MNDGETGDGSGRDRPWVALVRGFGVRVGMRTEAADLGAALASRLSPVYEIERHEIERLRARTGTPADVWITVVGAGERGHPLHLLRVDGRTVYRGSDLEGMVDRVEWEVARAVAERAPDHLFVHAGVVGWRGKAVLLPGRSMTGKTRLVAALVGHGARYLSDEYAVIDRRGLVHPYPRCLSFRSEDGSRVRRSAGELGAETAARPLRPSVVVATRYRPGGHWAPRSMSAAEVLMALLDNTVTVRSRPAFTMEVLRSTVRMATGMSSERGDTTEAAARILAAIRHRAA